MKIKKYSEKYILAILKEHEAGLPLHPYPVAKVLRKILFINGRQVHWDGSIQRETIP